MIHPTTNDSNTGISITQHDRIDEERILKRVTYLKSLADTMGMTESQQIALMKDVTGVVC